MCIFNFCIWIYILLKPFYLTKSGSLQISDFFIVIAFFIFLVKNNKKLRDIKINYLIFFVICVVVINLIYYFQYNDNGFIQATLFYIFILIGTITFTYKLSDIKFLRICYYLFIIDIILQILFYFSGIGKNWASSTRYMGTFNDPNQFAFFIFLCMMYIYTLGHLLEKKNPIWIYVLGIVLIFFSASTGMLLAVSVFAFINLFYNANKLIKMKNFFIKPKVMIVILSFILIIVFCLLNESILNNVSKFIDKEIVHSSIIERTIEKFNKASGDDILEDRHLEMLFNNPEQIILGAGQGAYYRFDVGGEIHSTIPSLLFCYGIVPTSILLYWVYINLKDIKFRYLIPYIAILIESFTLANQRQLLLWWLILLANTLKNYNSNYKEKTYMEENSD